MSTAFLKTFRTTEGNLYSIKGKKVDRNLPILVAGVMHKTDPARHAMRRGENE